MKALVSISAVIVAVLQVTVGHGGSQDAHAVADGCNGTTYYSQATSKTALGATHYHYKTPNGLPYDQIAPPVGFDPMTASNKQLEDANFSPRPTDSKQLKDWEIEAKAYRPAAISGGPMCSSVDLTESGHLSTPQSRGIGLTPQAHTATSIWSGYADLGNSTAGYFQKVVGHFTQPTLFATSTSAVTSWIGLNGGGGYPTLLQAGTVSHESHNDGHVFYEAYCTYGTAVCGPIQEPISTPDSYAQPGDDVSVNVNYADGPSSVNVRYQVAINGALIINIQQDYPTYMTSGSQAVYMTEKFPNAALPKFNVIGFSNLRTYPSWNSSVATYWGNQPFTSYVLTADGQDHLPPCDTVNNPNLLMYPYPAAGSNSTTAFYNRQC